MKQKTQMRVSSPQPYCSFIYPSGLWGRMKINRGNRGRSKAMKTPK